MNITELFVLLHEVHKSTEMNTIIEKLAPILECYFIIYQIMHDDDIENLMLKKSTSKKLVKKNIAEMEMILER